MKGFYEPIAGRRLPVFPIFILFGVLFGLPLCGYGQTNVSGNVSGTWTAAGSPYILTGSVTVPAGLTLTIQPGVEVQFPRYDWHLTVNGTLIANGTAADSIRFRGIANPGFNPSSSHGGYIRFESTSVNSSMDYVIVDRLGDTGTVGEAVSVNSSSVAINRSVIKNSEQMGISVLSSKTPAITNSYFTDNVTGIQLAANATATIDACSFGTNTRDINAAPSALSNFQNNNVDADIFILNGTISQNTTWPKVGTSSKLKLDGTATVASGVTLTILPGVEIEFPNYSTHLSISGTLLANGTAVDSIRFTGIANPGYAPSSSHGGYIRFESTSVNSSMDYVIVDRLGDTGTVGEAVSVNSSSVTINRSAIKNSEQYGISVSSSKTPAIMDCSFTNNGRGIRLGTSAVAPISNCSFMGHEWGIELGTNAAANITNCSFGVNTRDINAAPSALSNIQNNNTDADIYITSGTISQNTTWPKVHASSKLKLDGTTTVSSGVTLTVMSGVLVEFWHYQAHISVSGTLLANGTAVDSIRFVGIANPGYAPSSSHGGYIRFESTSVNSSMDYVIVDRLGDTGTVGEAVSVNSSSVTINRSAIKNSEQYGISVLSSKTPAITNSYFTDNVTGIQLAANATATIGACPFGTNTRDINAAPSALSNFQNNNVNADIFILNGTISQNTTWPKVGTSSKLKLDGTATVASGVTLTILPGVEIEFPNYNTYLSISGTLLANGTAADSIRFTGIANPGYAPSSSHGGYIRFESTSVNSSMDYVIVDRLGDTGTVGEAVSVNSSSVTINRSAIKNSEQYGISVSSSKTPAIMDCSFTNNGRGIRLGTSAVAPISNCSFTGHEWGIELGTNAAANITNCSFGVNTRDINAAPSALSNIQNNNTDADIYITSGTIGQNTTWPKVHASSKFKLDGTVTVSGGVSLTIMPGVLVEFQHYSAHLSIGGTFLANGTTVDSIRFVGIANPGYAPSSTHGGYIYFENTSVNSSLDYVIVDRLGDASTVGNALEIRSSQVSITNSVIKNAEQTGVYITNAAPLIRYTDIAGNQKGLVVAAGPFTILNCNIYGNTLFGIENTGPDTVDARSNGWGANTGPYHAVLNPAGQGNAVSNKVKFVPWSKSCGLQTLDAGLTSLVSPLQGFEAGSNPVSIVLRNFGAQTLTSAQMNWTLNGVAQTPYTWNGNLPTNTETTVNIGTYNFLPNLLYNITIWPDQPNGQTDQCLLNDTVSVSGWRAALSGTYTVGGISPDFTNFTAAANALMTYGVSGSVTFNVRNGTYTEQITLGEIPGVDSLHQVVFQSELGDSSQVTLRFNANSAANFTVRLNGADWITFQRMTIAAQNTGYGRAVSIEAGANHITLANAVLSGPATVSISTNLAILSASGTVTNNYLRLLNCRLPNGSYGLYYAGPTAGGIYATGTLVSGNRLEGQTAGGVYLTNNKDVVVEGNTIMQSANFTSYAGVQVDGATGAPRVSGNSMSIVSDGYGILANGFSGTAGTPALIANNYIKLGSGANNNYGIYCTGSFYKIVYNSIRIDGTTSSAAALYIGSNTTWEAANNICANFGGGLAVNLNFSPNGNQQFDYNDLYSAGPNILRLSGVDYANLTVWKNAGIGFDEHSISANPFFYGAAGYRVGQIALNGAGKPDALITQDIEGNPRDAQHPDIGADEYTPPAADAGVHQLIVPAAPFPAGVQPVQALVKNFGAGALTSATIQWTVNGVAQTPVAWAGNLAPGNTEAADLPGVLFVIGQATSIKAWTTIPNSVADPVPVNDTMAVNNLYPGLGGNYTIGGISPAFPTFTPAVSALLNGGAVGPVVFNVRDGAYTEQVSLGPVLGTGPANTVTFQSESNDSTAVTLQFNAFVTQNFTVRLNGADWIRFRKMTLQALNAAYAVVVDLRGGSDQNIFENNRFIGIETTTASATRALIMSESDVDNFNLIRNNYFLNSSTGILMTGLSGNWEKGNTIVNNQFAGQYYRAMQLTYQDDPVIAGNTVNNTATYLSYIGMQLSNCAGYPRILKNNLYLGTGLYGIELGSCSGSVSQRGIVANNFVRVSSTNTAAAGIRIGSCSYIDLVFNNSLINTAVTASRAGQLNNSTNTRVYNNIFAHTGGGNALYLLSNGAGNQIDYNDLYNTGANNNLVSSNGTLYATRAAWTTASGFDAHSLSLDPLFVSANDLHTTNVLLDKTGAPVAGVIDDIDGEVRHPTTPDIGADEFATAANDAGVLSINYPKRPFAAGMQPVLVTLFNNGLDTLGGVQVNWSVNGAEQPAFNWTGTLLSGDVLDSVTIGNFNFAVDTTYSIRAWTTAPNGMSDGDLTNDSAQVNNLHAALGGYYTIGGVNPVFPTFTAAVNALNQGGVIDSVYFNVRAGTYTEQLLLKEVFGASPANTITFQSESGDSAGVVLTFNATLSTANYTLRLDSADYFRFKNMSLKASNATYGRVLELLHGANSNIFEGNLFQNNIFTGTSELVYSAGDSDNFNVFRHNRFVNGRRGLYLVGGNQANNRETGLQVVGNVFDNQTEYGMYLLSIDSILVSGNTVATNTTNLFSGIEMFDCVKKFRIEKNRLLCRTGAGITLRYCYNTVGNEGRISNNFITVGNQQNLAALGISLSSSDRNSVVHNNVHITSLSVSSRAYDHYASINVEVVNNVFYNSGLGYAFYNYNTASIASDYNDLVSNGTNVGYWHGNISPTLAAWQAYTGQDAHSRSLDPRFVSETDLHVQEVDLNNAGNPVAAVTDDIDGEPRNALTPDIGADEFAPMGMHDVGVEYLVEPNDTTPFAAGFRDVKAVIKNSGADTILAFTVQWQVNGLPKTPYAWSGLLYPGERDTAVIGTHYFGIGTPYDLFAYTQAPNGFADSNPANDTARVDDLYAALDGAYTIGGVAPTFPDFSAAVTTLIKGGVLGPVTFNVRNGAYNENFTITQIKGSTPDKVVTFQSESGDSALVTLTKTGQNGGEVVRLDGADNLVFQKMTFRAPNADFFYLNNGVSNVQFLNNRFTEASTTGDTYIQAAGSIANDADIKVLNNRFEGGINAVYLSGYSNNALESGTVIEGNTIVNPRGTAIDLAYQNAPLIRNNSISTNAPGLYCNQCNNGLQITGNRISIGQNSSGIQLWSCSGAADARGLIANNFISAGGTNYVYGIQSAYGSFQNIYHNNIRITNTSASSRALEILYTANDKRVMGNVLANTGGGYAYYVQNPASLQASDYNDLYSSGPNLAYWSNTNLTNLPLLQNLSTRELNSVSVDPLFYSATDLHVLQAALDSAATPLPEVAADIDGQPRMPNAPDIGADEFDYRTDDVGITALLQPRDTCELGAAAAVKVVIQNFGGLPQTGFDVAYKRGYGVATVENIGARTVQPGDTIHYTFAQAASLSAYQAHMLTLYTKLNGDLDLSRDTLVAFVTNYQTPAAPGNMLPADGAVNVSPPVSFSWLPAAGATRYDIYIWKADQAQPTTPTAQDLTQISYYYNLTSFVYGATYKWQLVAKNNYCSTTSPIRQFTLLQQSDLVAGSVMAPAMPFSGTSISVSWTTTNSGAGATGMQAWYDYVYLSADAVFQADVDTYLGGALNLTALNPGQGYTQMLNVTLPQGIQGNYYLIVRADAANHTAESNENNNTAAAFPLVVNLTPPPDLKVTSIVAPTNAFSGQPVNISFTVKNQGSGDVPPGITFQDYVYLGASPVLNLSTATLVATYTTAPLAAGAFITRNFTTTLPLNKFGDYYVHVYTDRFNKVYEFAFEDNNISVSDTLTIFLTPPPDLVVNQVSGPAFVSNRQNVSVQWTAENQGATAAAGPWTDQVYISKAAVYHTDSVTHLGAFPNPGNLAAGASAVRMGTVTIPANIVGPYYFYVYADIANKIFEYDQENNNTARSAGTTAVLTADLVVSSVTAPATSNSGTAIPVEWTVANVGQGSVLNTSRTDRVYLSQNPVLSIPAATLMGTVSQSGSLLSGQSAVKQLSVTLPNGISGPYFLHVVTDAGNSVFEDQQENNNTNQDTTQIALTPWPDLTPLSIDALPDTVPAGSVLPFGYSVQNNGAGPVPGANAWSDQVYISANPVFSGMAYGLKSISVQPPLAANATYAKSAGLNIPAGYFGTYYFYVETDRNNQVYEHTAEGNNVLRSGPVFVRAPGPPDPPVVDPVDPVDFDLMEDETTFLPDTLYSGQQVTVGWCIQNLGSSTAKFNFQIWYDGVYLSVDSIWDEYADIFVKDFTKNGPVDSLQEYNNTQSFKLPNGLSGDYYAFLVADHNERTNDEAIANNIGLIRPASFPAGPAKPVHIQLSPSPDLEARNFLTPSAGISGQPVQVIWTVKNNGPAATTGAWTDKVYLSTNFTIDGNDAIIGSKSQSRVLAAGQQYIDTLDVFLPVNASGNYVLIFKTDANNTLYEHNAEGNNTFFSYIAVTPTAPCDLVVNGTSFDAMATVDEPFTVSWTIQNQGGNPASGTLRELIYFSADSLFDADDVPLSAAIQRNVSLAPGASASKSFTANTPGVPLGDYYLIVATDVLDNILESNEGNNRLISTQKVTVTVKELPIGILTPDTLRNNTPLYYRIEVPGNLDDETLLLTLDGLTPGGLNELYLSHEKAPTRSSHDFAFGNPNQPDQSILVGELDSGTYYLLAYGATDNLPAGGKQNIALKAEIVDFAILSVAAAEGGNTGNVTVRVDGAKFSPGMTLKLTDPGLGTRIATKVTYMNSTRVFATFNLAGAAAGLYDVVAMKQTETATLSDGFTVLAGDAGTTSAGDGSSGFFCNIVNIGTDQNLSQNVVHPSAVRINRLVPITIQYGNSGNVDIPAPARFLLSLRGAPLGFAADELQEKKQELYLAFQETGGPEGILRPGSFSSITVYAFSSHPLLFVLRE